MGQGPVHTQKGIDVVKKGVHVGSREYVYPLPNEIVWMIGSKRYSRTVGNEIEATHGVYCDTISRGASLSFNLESERLHTRKDNGSAGLMFFTEIASLPF